MLDLNLETMSSSIYIPLELEAIEKSIETERYCDEDVARKMIEEIRILRQAVMEMDADAEEAIRGSMSAGAEAMKNAAMEVVTSCSTIEEAMKRMAMLNCEVRLVSEMSKEELDFVKASSSSKKPKGNPNLH